MSSLAPRPTVAQREAAEDRLRRAAGEGLLTLEEYGDRVALVLAANTAEELRQVTADLPVSQQQVTVTRRRARRGQRWLIAVMGGHEEKGRWRPAETTNALAVMGGVDIDLREAEVEEGELTINATAVMGGIEIIVPEGVEVEMTGFAIMGGRDNKARHPDSDAAPLLRVNAYAFMGGVEVRNPKKKELRQTQEGGGATVLGETPATWSGSAPPPVRRDARPPARRANWLGRGIVAAVIALFTSPIWLPGQGAVAVFGSDQMRVEAGETVRANPLFGSVQIVVPDDVRVQRDGFIVFGSAQCDACLDNPPDPDPAGTIEVNTFGAFGSVEIIREGQLRDQAGLREQLRDLEARAERADEQGNDALEAQLEAQAEAIEDRLDQLD